MAKKDIICAACGSQGKPLKKVKGHFLLELVLWLFFLIPGLIYSIWRLSSKYQACAACGSETLIPLDSPRGQQIAKGNL